MNFNSEDVVWVNQTLFSYKDKMYSSDGSLELYISSSTNDYINFSSPRFNFTVDNNGKRRTCSLNIHNVLDLLNSFNEVNKDINAILLHPQTGDITKKITGNKDLIFEFRVSQMNNEPIVIIKISYGHSDEGKVIVSYISEYITIGKLLRVFYENYHEWCLNLPMRFINGNILIEQKLNNSILRSLPSQLIPPLESFSKDFNNSSTILSSIINNIKCNESNNLEKIVENNTTENPNNINNEFNSFLKEEEKNIVIKEFETTAINNETINQEFESYFIDTILNYDIKEYETLILSLITAENQLSSICEILKIDLNTILPMINNDEIRSTLYISNLFFRYNLQLSINNNTSLPNIIPVIKYNPSLNEVSEFNKILSYDIFMITFYLKCFRSRMETTIPDIYSNGSIIYVASRCFLDILLFSFIDINANYDSLNNLIISRFNYFRNKGFFKYYDNMITSHEFPEITSNELSEILKNVLSTIVKHPNIINYHIRMINDNFAKLQVSNIFSTEQILNEIINMEIKVKLGKEIKELTNNNDILDIFNSKNARPKILKESETNILRWIKFNKQEIPPKIQIEFIKYIEDMKNNSYDFNNGTFITEELGENIVKGLYVWNEHINSKITYTNFAAQIQECISKSLILAKLMNKTENIEEGNWIN